MDPTEKEPYERAAAADANRYRREVYSYSYFSNNVRLLTLKTKEQSDNTQFRRTWGLADSVFTALSTA